ncbi:MAG: transposase [Thiotrichales bacterium]|jgi:REP element-mobilizing transposase RayT|nr:transposase [Thiotrichales bacterium]MBT3613615.1 transposase [Thiotrichales bacterium]MBT3752339.1 transposase [Thiotrichales bacterium]MBT3837127.1 transposase [Thiotrichales bacterium]MBT4152996.1 transposase [Thiotrichales bacterium]
MARPLRIEFAGALHHITSRGNSRDPIFLCDSDRELFMQVLKESCDIFNWSVHAWCLMDNHYHLLVGTPEANLSKGMRYLNGVYTQRFNRNNAHIGHLFQGRFKGILVDEDRYLLELARYIVLNPVRARMVDSAESWAWSSYRVMVGLVPAPTWFDRDWLLSHFGEDNKTAIYEYMKFVANGVSQPSPWKMLRGQIFLGDEQFVDEIQSKFISKDMPLREIPVVQKRAIPQPLEHYSVKNQSRNKAITEAYFSGGYTLQDIGNYFDLHYSSVSRIIHKSLDRDAKVKT